MRGGMNGSLSEPLNAGDGAMKAAQSTVKEAISTIQDRRSAIDRLATMMLSAEERKDKAQKAKAEGLKASEEAKESLRRIDTAPLGTDRKAHENLKKKFGIDASARGLDKATKDLEVAFNKFEEDCKKAPCTRSGPVDLEFGRSSSSSGVPSWELRPQGSATLVELQETTISQGEAEIHAQCTADYHQKTSSILETQRSLRQMSNSLKEMAQGQSHMVDSIQDHAERAATHTQSATEQLQQTNTARRNSNKWIWRALLLAMILCSIIIYVVVRKANRR
eukprot:TRINITY_DN102405_c0_g1_i1.p1 TRINITY_DN102405_c0_g1~~TRINITY_DN102405_c0_g1_i1.p1  ORF type:complete len:278 (+),score=60.75 TRINITY_DN102405_c0_g1_i1:50-883(+)